MLKKHAARVFLILAIVVMAIPVTLSSSIHIAKAGCDKDNYCTDDGGEHLIQLRSLHISKRITVSATLVVTDPDSVAKKNALNTPTHS